MRTFFDMDEKGKGGCDIMTPLLLDIRPQSLSFCPYSRSLWLYNPSSTSSGKDVIATLSILPPPSDRGRGGDEVAVPPALHLEGPFFEYSEDHGLLKVESGSRVEIRASVSAATDLGGGDNKCCSAITGAIVVNYEGGQETVVPVIFEPEGALEDKDGHIHALTEEVVRLKYGGTELMLKNEIRNNNITMHAQDDSVNHSNLLEEWQPRQKKPLQFSSSLDLTTTAVEEKRASNDALDTAPQSYLAAQAWWLHLACSNVNPIGAPDVRREQQSVPHEQTQSSGGIGVVETDSNHYLCQQTQQLALDLSLSRQMILEAEIKARTTAWEQEERLAAATLRIMALEAELRSRNSECDAQSAGLDEESSAAIFGYSIIDDKKERVTPLHQTLEIERKKRIDAEMKEKAQTQLAEFEQARYIKLKKRTENLVHELDRLKIASTVNVMEGPIKATPRMILESFVGVTRKQSERIAELEKKMDRNLAMHDSNNNTEGGGGIEVVVDDNVMNGGGGMKVENTTLIASLETERLSRRLKEVEGELRSARDKSVTLERRLSSLLHFGSDNKGSKCVSISDDTTKNLQVGENTDGEAKSISCRIEVDTLKSELQATLAHNIELKDALLQSESSVIPPVGDLFGEVGLKHDSDSHIIPHLEIDNFLDSCKNVLLPSSPSTVLESETTVRLEAELQETRSKLKVLEMTLEVLQESVVSEQQPEEEEVLDEAQSQEDGPSQVTTFSTLLFTSIPTTKQRLVQYCMTLATEVNSLRTTAAVADRRVTSLLRAVSSAESCRLVSEGGLSAMEKRVLLAERLGAEREAQIEALIVEGRSRLREAYMESQTLRRAIEGQKAQAEEQAVAVRVAQATSDAMEVKLLQFLDQRQQNEWDVDQTSQKRLEDTTEHIAATCYTATHSIDLVLSNLESMWANVTQTADRYKDEGEGHKGLRKMMKNCIFCSTAEKEELLGVEKLRRLIPDYDSNCNNGQRDGGSCIDGGQLVKYMRLLAELLDTESLKALRLKAIAETELRWSREEVEILKRSLKEYHVEQCRLQARVKASEQALLSCYLSSTRGRRQMVDHATISTHEQEELGVCADVLLRHRAFAALERALEAASQLALMRQRCISLKEEVDSLHRVLEEMRFNMEASEVEFHAKIAEAVGDALKESESSFRRNIEDKIECWFETELAPLVHLDGVVGLPVGEHLVRVLAVCKAREAEALVQVSSYQMRFLPLLKQNEKLRAFVKSFAIHMKNSKPPIPHHSAGAATAVTTDGQGSICFYSETMSKAQSQQAILRAQLLESRDTANRFAAEASSLKCLVKKIREDEYNVRKEASERILQVQAGMRRIKRGKAVNVGANSLFIPECSHFKHGLGGTRRNRSNRKVPQPQKQDEKRGEGPLCPRGSLVEEVKCGAHGYNNVDEEMLATSSSSVLCHDLDNVKKYGTEQPGDHSNIHQHVTANAVFDRLAAEAADSKVRVEYLESLLSESSTLTESLLKDAENATMVSGGNWQASELMIAVRSVAATLEKMVKERGFKEAHMKRALARRERRIKELKAKLKHAQFIEKVVSIQSPKGMHRFSAGSVVGAATAVVKRSKGTKCGGASSIFELGLTEKATVSGLGQQTSKESGGDATPLPKNNTYLINDEPQEDLMCPGCEELTKLLKGSEDRCLVLQHKVDEYCVVQPPEQPQQPLTQVRLEKETVYCPPPPREGGERKLDSGKGKRINCIEHESDESILTAAAAMMGKDAAAMDGESSTHLMGELLTQQKAHAAALETMQTLQTKLFQESSILREENVELEERMKVEIASTEDVRSALKASNAKCVELENQVIQANQKVASQLTADIIALEEMSQAHKGVVRALKQSLMAVKAKAMINTATLAKRTQFVPDTKEKKQKYPDCGLCDRRSEAAILRSILVQSNTTLAELQIQLRLAKEESKVATAQLEIAMRRLSVLMSTYESKSEDLLLPPEELEKEHIHLQDKDSISMFQNNCMLNSVLQTAKLEILEAQCEEQHLLLNSMEEDLMLARQQLELQEKLMDENVHLSNDSNIIKIIKPSSPSSTATHFCNVSEDEKEQQRSTTTTQAELSRLKELILQQANACPSSEDAAYSKEKELESLKASLATQKAEANRRGRALAALREVKAVNETEFVELKEKLKTCEEKLAQCLRRLGIKSTLVAQLKKQREELQTEVGELRRSSPQSTEERNAITTTTKGRDRLRSQLTMYRTKVKSLTKTVELSQVNEASVKAAEERASQSEARSKELKREITRKRQDVMIWKQRAEECKMDAEQLRNEMDLLKNNKKPEAVAASPPTTATRDALIDSLKSSLIEGVRSYAMAGRMRIFGNNRTEIRSNRLAVAAMDTNITGRRQRQQQQQHGLDSSIVSSMLGVTLNEAVEMMHCTSENDDMDEFDWVSRAQCALLQWDGNMFWEVVREISSVRQPDGVSDGGVLATSEEENCLASNLTGDKAGTLLVDDETGMVAEWGECLQCAKEILSS